MSRLVQTAAPDKPVEPGEGQKYSPSSQLPSVVSAAKKRAAEPLLVVLFAVRNLIGQLPLLFPVDPKLPPSPKLHYRSHYRYLGPSFREGLEKSQRVNLSEFELALYLIDFSPLERLLAQYYRPSHKGQVPFHPVSLFLCVCLRRELGYSWRRLAKVLANKEHGAGWRKLFGFAEGETPSASGLRYFFKSVGAKTFNELCPLFIDLLRQNNLLPEHSTYPGDDEERGVTITQDGMLHVALSRPSCILATNECYQPLADEQMRGETVSEEKSEEGASQESVEARRQCRAQEKGQTGCNCDTAECQERCRRASRLDSEARFIHYEGNNKKDEGKGDDGKGINIFGYRSLADRILDDRLAVAWTALSDLYPANTDERTLFVERLRRLRERFPDLKIGECLYDAAVGYEPCLEAIWKLGALRMVDIRADESDKNFEGCVSRGYDGEGYPLCPHGYRLTSNGYDYDHRRRKWVCGGVCRREPRRKGEAVAAVTDCPYLDRERPLGYIVNVGKTLPNGNMRLARDIPYGSPLWKARYGRRNLSESRNGQMEGLGLKRMKSYGLERDNKELQIGDFLLNLRTLGRLVMQATDLSEN